MPLRQCERQSKQKSAANFHSQRERPPLCWSNACKSCGTHQFEGAPVDVELRPEERRLSGGGVARPAPLRLLEPRRRVLHFQRKVVVSANLDDNSARQNTSMCETQS